MDPQHRLMLEVVYESLESGMYSALLVKITDADAISKRGSPSRVSQAQTPLSLAV